MKNYNNYPEWAIKLFTNLCFSQVKEQLPENLMRFYSNPPSFIYNGQLFAFTPNESFITDEPTSNFETLYN